MSVTYVMSYFDRISSDYLDNMWRLFQQCFLYTFCTVEISVDDTSQAACSWMGTSGIFFGDIQPMDYREMYTYM